MGRGKGLVAVELLNGIAGLQDNIQSRLESCNTLNPNPNPKPKTIGAELV